MKNHNTTQRFNFLKNISSCARALNVVGSFMVSLQKTNIRVRSISGAIARPYSRATLLSRIYYFFNQLNVSDVGPYRFCLIFGLQRSIAALDLEVFHQECL